MSFPNHPNKYYGEPVMQPADTIAMRRRFGQFPDIKPPQGLVLCMKNGLPQKMRWKVPIRKVGRVMGDMHIVNRTRGRVCVLSNFGIGAAVVVSLAEEMIAWGIRKFIILSWGGGLGRDLNTGDIVLNDKAIRDEGVSQHYLPTEKYVEADSALQRNLGKHLTSRAAKFTTGSTWTTDAPYMETRQEIIKYQSEGVKVVEMEIAGLFALAHFRNVQAASLVVVADRLASLAWEPPMDMKAINASFEAAYNAAIDSLNEDA